MIIYKNDGYIGFEINNKLELCPQKMRSRMC